MRPELGPLGDDLERVTAGLTTAPEELPEFARGIHPAVLTDGLGAAMKMLARRCLIPVDPDMRTEGRLPEPVEVAAYYVVSEALTNAAKHANAATAAVCVEAVTGVLKISVREEGRGAPASPAARAWPVSTTAWKRSAAGFSPQPACRGNHAPRQTSAHQLRRC